MLMRNSNNPLYICARFRRKVSSLKSDLQLRILEKETYICVRFKINEAFKEAGLSVDFYKRSLT